MGRVRTDTKREGERERERATLGRRRPETRSSTQLMSPYYRLDSKAAAMAASFSWSIHTYIHTRRQTDRNTHIADACADGAAATTIRRVSCPGTVSTLRPISDAQDGGGDDDGRRKQTGPRRA